MNTFKTSADQTALTLAFGAAAFAPIKISHPWRYFIAGGETLEKIEQFINEYDMVAQACLDLAAEVGAEKYDGEYFSFTFPYKRDEIMALTGKERVDYHASGEAYEPRHCKRIARIPDFIITDGRSSGDFYPDVSTPRGKEIQDKCKELKARANPAQRLAEWLGCSGMKIALNPHCTNETKIMSAAAYKIGDQWIIAVPAVTQGANAQGHGAYGPYVSFTEEWTVPPGSAPLAISAYFKLLEDKKLIHSIPAPAPAAPG